MRVHNLVVFTLHSPSLQSDEPTFDFQFSTGFVLLLDVQFLFALPKTKPFNVICFMKYEIKREICFKS